MESNRKGVDKKTDACDALWKILVENKLNQWLHKYFANNLKKKNEKFN